MDSKTAEERMKAIEQKLNEYEGRCSLPCRMAPGTDLELNEYLTMSRERINALTIPECANIAYRLAQYSFYITRLINVERSNKMWAEAILRELLAGVKDNYGQYTKHELKIELLAKENAFASKLNSIVRYTSQRIQRLDGVADAINFLSKVILDVRWAKHKRESSNE